MQTFDLTCNLCIFEEVWQFYLLVMFWLERLGGEGTKSALGMVGYLPFSVYVIMKWSWLGESKFGLSGM